MKRTATELATSEPKRSNFRPPDAKELEVLKDKSSHILQLTLVEVLHVHHPSVKKINKLQKFSEEIMAAIKTMLRTDGSRQVKIPIENTKLRKKTLFKPPTDVKMVGGFSLQLSGSVDLIVTIPDQYFKNNDESNSYFHLKSAYLGYIAENLLDKYNGMQFNWRHGNRYQPMLVIPCPFNLHNVYVHITIGNELFKEQSLCPGDYGPNGPFYSTAIISDKRMQHNHSYLENVFANHPSLQEGVKALKIWLKQRQLASGLGCFSNFIITMFVAYLVKTSRLNNRMNGYQVFRLTLLHLSQSNMNTTGLSMCDTQPEGCNLTDFLQCFPVVFIDPSGYLNLCADVSLGTYCQVKREAKFTVEFLQDEDLEKFHMIMTKPMPNLLQFDQLIQILDISPAKEVIKKDLNVMQSHDVILSCMRKVEEILNAALSRRTVFISPCFAESVAWAVTENPIFEPAKFVFGIKINPETWMEAVEKGPSPESPKAKEFCNFWGGKAELRKFQDGICYAVYIPCSTMQDRRLVVGQMAQHALCHNLCLKPTDIVVICGQLDKMITMPYCNMKGTGEEVTQKILGAFGQLHKDLLSIASDLPLNITSVKGISSVFRHTELGLPIQSMSKEFTLVKNGVRIPDLSKPSPLLMPSFTALCMLEGSGKWPEDIEAICRVKAAFLLKMAELLRSIAGVVVNSYSDHLLVVKDGFVFRIEIAHLKEITLLKMNELPDGTIQQVDTPQSKALEYYLIHRPKYTAFFEILPKQVSFAATARLVKRWLASHMLDDTHIPGLAVDLLVASLFVHPAPYEVVHTPLIGFLRFLQLLSTFDWQIQPLILNFGQKMSMSEVNDISDNFQKNRATLPLMFISTPADPMSSYITQQAPIAPVLTRLAFLAKQALDLLSDSLVNNPHDHHLTAFKTSNSIFDVVIKLRRNQIATRHFAISNKGVQESVVIDMQKPAKAMPVHDYDPVRLYLSALRDAFDDVAVFFCDTYGGDVVGVIWKPSAGDSVNFDKVVIVDDFSRMGEGLVKSVQLHDTTK